MDRHEHRNELVRHPSIPHASASLRSSLPFCLPLSLSLTCTPLNVFSKRFELAKGRTSHILTLLSIELDNKWLPSGLRAKPAGARQHMMSQAEGDVNKNGGMLEMSST